MANPSNMTWVFLLAVLHTSVFQFGKCSVSSIAQRKFQIPQVFGQNLTGEIDMVLKEKNFNYRRAIKEALGKSQIVYYESDILLNEIQELIPVIDLLNDLSSEESLPVKITLSLPYLNKTHGLFLSHRLEDIYYNLDTNITATNKTKLLNSLASITLGFVSQIGYRSSIFSYGVTPPNDFKLVNYVKNFIYLYFGRLAIPVGVMFNHNMMYNDFVIGEISQADFTIFNFELDLSSYFPVFMEVYDVINYLPIVPKNATLLIAGIGKLSQTAKYTYFDQDYDALIMAVCASSQYQNATETFFSKINQRSNQLFNYVSLTLADMENRDVILGSALQNSSSELFAKNVSRVQLIVPFIKLDETRIEVFDLKEQFTKWSSEYESVLLDERSWRTLARFQLDLEDSGLICNETAMQNNQQNSLKVFVHFTVGIATQWSVLKKYMDHHIHQYAQIGQISMEAIIFHEQDVTKSLEIQKFLTSAKRKYKIGCSVQYESIHKIFRNFTNYGGMINENTFKMESEKSLCQPVFPLLDIIIWYAPQQEKTEGYRYLGKRLVSAYSDIFLTRAVFQKDFPHIKVYIHFHSSFDKRILANVFDVPIIVPSEQILY